MSTELLVTSDIAPLKKVVVQRPGKERVRTHILTAMVDSPGFASDYIGEAALAEHDQFTALLESKGAEVLEVRDLLNDAILHAREAGIFESFIQTNFPRLVRFEQENNIDADDLIGATNKSVTLSNGTRLPATHPLQWMYYTRDSAMSVPEGIVLGNFDNNSRIPEVNLIRFMYQYSEQLKDFPIVFDAQKEGVLLQGGDFITFDEHTILLGIDNMSSREAAARLAQKLNKLVVGVQLPKGAASEGWRFEDFTTIHGLFLHLDTIFNLVDTNAALAVPYFLQDEFSDDSPLARLLNDLSHEPLFTVREQQTFTSLQKIIDELGNVRLFEAGTGKAHPTGKKLINFLQEEFNYRTIFAGGRPSHNPAEQRDHLIETVLPELRFQAANVVATKPGEVLMYSHDTTVTQQSLKEGGITIIPFDGDELRRWNGGPHCMTSPIVRSSENL